MIISQIEPLFNGRSPATGVKKGEKLANKRIYLHSDNLRIRSTVNRVKLLDGLMAHITLTIKRSSPLFQNHFFLTAVRQVMRFLVYF